MQRLNATIPNCALRSYRTIHTRSIVQAKVAVNAGIEDLVSVKPTSAVPGPTQFQLIRGFLPGGIYYKKQLPEFLQISRKIYGDLIRIPALFGKPEFFVSFKPEDFEVVIRTEGVWPRRRGLETMTYHRLNRRPDVFQGLSGLLGSNGELWGDLRSKINPLIMQPKSMRQYVDKMHEVSDEFLQRIREIRDSTTLEVPGNFENEINRLTFETVAVIALDKQIGLIRKNRHNPEAEDIFKSLKDIFALIYDLDVAPSMWKVFKTPKFYKLMKALDAITDNIVKHINEAKDRLEMDEKSGISRSDVDKSVLEKMLKIDNRFAVIMALDMLMAGVDTTTTTLTGILLCIAKNPEKQKLLRQEVCKLLPNKDSKFTAETLANMPYLRACIKEGIRLYPIGSGLFRSAGIDIVLSGYRIPKDADIILDTAGLFRDERFFPNANAFLPERWLRGEKSGNSVTNPFAYIPFGMGPRTCVGKRIVDLELEVTVGRLVRNFNIEFNYSTENAFKSVLISVPAIPLRFKFAEVEN